MARRLVAEMHPLLPEERCDAQDAGQVEPQDDDDHAPDPGDPILVDAEELPQEGGRGPHEEEDDGEARDEEPRVDQHGAPIGSLLEIVQGHPGHEAQVAGHQGKHAGGQERQEARRDGDEDPDLVNHACPHP